MKIRLAEIHAPEKGQAYGTRSRQHLAGSCYMKPAVVIPSTTDRYGRTVARVACEGHDVNQTQVRAGMAWAFKRYLTDPAIAESEISARTARRGLWAEPDPVAPWTWRREHKGSLASVQPD